MKSIGSRLSMTFALSVAAALGIFCAFAHLRIREKLAYDLDHSIADKAALLNQSIHHPDLAIHEWTERYLRLDHQRLFVQLFDTEGRFIEKRGHLENPIPITDYARDTAGRLQNTGAIETLADGAGNQYRVATFAKIYPSGVWGYSQAGVSLDSVERRAREILVWLLAASVAVLIVSSLIARFLIGQWLKSLTAATATARQIGAQNLAKQRLPVVENDAELAELARAFNELLDKLEASHSTQQRFVADASHELRTPLTVVRGEIDVALRRDRPIEEYQEVLRSSKEEIEGLSRLVDNLLALAHADAGEVIASRREVNLEPLLADVVEKLTPFAEEQKVQLATESLESAAVNGDSYGLHRVFLNLIENGLRYTPAGETVTVRMKNDAMNVTIEIEDTGPGIARDHLPRLFERFYRVDKSRSREFGGAGLGLSIVQTLIQAHGGSIRVESELGKGTKFIVTLPKT